MQILVTSDFGHFYFDSKTGEVLVNHLDKEFGAMPRLINIEALKESPVTKMGNNGKLIDGLLDSYESLDVGYWDSKHNYIPPAENWENTDLLE